MNNTQKELAKWIQDALEKEYKEWNVEVCENVFGHKWAVVFVEKTDDLVKSVCWFPYDSFNNEDDAEHIIKEIILRMAGIGMPNFIGGMVTK